MYTYILLLHRHHVDLRYNYIEEPIPKVFDRIIQSLLYTDFLLMLHCSLQVQII